MSAIVWYLSFADWLISLSIMPSSSNHVVANKTDTVSMPGPECLSQEHLLLDQILTKPEPRYSHCQNITHIPKFISSSSIALQNDVSIPWTCFLKVILSD